MARKKDEAESKARMEERKHIRETIDSLREKLELQETDDDNLSEEEVEIRMSIIAEIEELEQQLQQGGGESGD